MEGGPVRSEETTGERAPARHLAAPAVWAAVIGVSPWLPAAAGVEEDLSGVSVVLSMVACGLVASLLLGASLGRARSWSLLAACAVLGPAVWVFDFTALGDPDVHADPAFAVLGMGFLGFWALDAPLLAGALASRFCWSATRRPVARAGTGCPGGGRSVGN